MHDTKLVQILRSFSREEMKGFEKFVSSPYHNMGKNCQPLVKELRAYHPAYDSSALNYENMHKKLYPGKKFNKQVMWNLASVTEKMADEFLAAEAMKGSFEKQVFLAKEYSSRKLPKHLNRQLERMTTLLEGEKLDSTYFSNKASLEKYIIDSNFLEDKQHMATENILKRGEDLLLGFLMEICENINDLEVNYTMYNADYRSSIAFRFIENLDLKGIAGFAKEKHYEYSFIIEICCHWIKLLIEPGNESDFRMLKEIFFRNEDKLGMYEKFVLTSALTTFCTNKIYSGSKEFRKDSFEINNYRLLKGVAFYPEGQLPKNIYKQMVINALMLGELTWTEDFISKYTKTLKPEFRKPMKALAQAFLHFQQGQFDSVLNDLHSIEYMDIRDKTHVKILTAQSYYELRQTEPLLSHIDTSKHFLKNNDTVNETRKKDYGNFFSILHRLVHARENPKIETLTTLKHDINSLKELTSRKWLLEKLNELEKTLQ